MDIPEHGFFLLVKLLLAVKNKTAVIDTRFHLQFCKILENCLASQMETRSLTPRSMTDSRKAS